MTDTSPTASGSPARRGRVLQTGQKGDLHAEVLVLGAGPGGYTAAFRAADLGKRVVMVDSRGEHRSHRRRWTPHRRRSTSAAVTSRHTSAP